MRCRRAFANAVRIVGGLVAFIGGVSSSGPLSGQAGGVAREDVSSSDDFSKKVEPFLARHCFGCHGHEKPRGDLVLDRFHDAAAAFAEAGVWEKVLRRIQAREMPPKARPRPEEAEIADIQAWLELAAQGGDRRRSDPGRVTLRRLNRAEYNNTIRDLVGVDFRPGDDFPADDVGYGFDNIGDVLSLPPLLAEKYLAAAEAISEKAIETGPAPGPPSRRFEADKLDCTAAESEKKQDFVALLSEGEVGTTFSFPQAGKYVLRVEAYQRRAGKESALMAFRCDGRELSRANVEAFRSSPGKYEAQVDVEPGDRRVAVAFLNDFRDPEAQDPKRRDRDLVVNYLEIVGPVDVKPRRSEPHERIVICDMSGPDRPACLEQILERFASRAYRRPATPDEVQRLVAIVESVAGDGASLAEALRVAVTAVLVSPYFLFRVELDPEPRNADHAHAVNDFELAARLSYFLWSSLPDDELWSLARAGKLSEDATLESQALRLLKDAKSAALTEGFCSQWLTLRNLAVASPDHGRFPSFDDNLRAAMRKESDLFFEAIVREDRSILEFLDADFTFLNGQLAKHYGYAGVEGSEFRRVPLEGGWRGGVLTQASVLTVTSNPTRTSPVKRGKWILEQILGTPPPPPPPGVGELKEGEAALHGTLRQRMEQHRANPLCASCHEAMDPLGFGLECFDAVGAYREEDGGIRIDASGTLPDGSRFNGPAELKAVLKSRGEQFTRAFAVKMLTFALGRGVEYYDRRAVDAIAAEVRAKGHRFSSLVLAIVKSEPFRMRRGDRSDP